MMRKKLTGGEWLTWREAIRWKMVHMLLSREDAGYLADALYHGILYHSLGANPDLTNPHILKLKKKQDTRYQLYYILRWMQRREINPKA